VQATAQDETSEPLPALIVAEDGMVTVVVEHFELDGWAMLTLAIEPMEH